MGGGVCCSLELSAHRHLLSVFSPRCRSWTSLLLIEAGAGLFVFALSVFFEFKLYIDLRK